jgi:hypothetical protein
MNDRDDKILKDIGKHGLSIRAVIEKRHFEGATADHVINRLVREKRIFSVPGIPGGLNYYQLTLSEARARLVPEHRSRPKKGTALRQALQVLWFSCMTDKNRNLLERRKITETFGKGNGSGKPHCAEIEGEQSIVYRIYAPGPNSRDDYLLKCLRSDSEKSMLRGELRSWIEAKAFSFAVLVETPERKERLKRMISKTGPHIVRIHVEVTPGLSTIANALRKQQEENLNGN